MRQLFPSLVIKVGDSVEDYMARVGHIMVLGGKFIETRERPPEEV